MGVTMAVNVKRRASDLQVRILALDDLRVARVDRLGDRDEGQRGLDVAPGLDPPTGDRDGDVLLALEVLVGGLGGHRHLDLGLPVDVVGPLPVEVAVLALAGGADVDHHVDVGELEALRDVGRAQLWSHVGIGVHHREDPVHDLPELLGRLELRCHHNAPSRLTRLSYTFSCTRARTSSLSSSTSARSSAASGPCWATAMGSPKAIRQRAGAGGTGSGSGGRGRRATRAMTRSASPGPPATTAHGTIGAPLRSAS